MRPLKVYAWTGMRREAPGQHHQTSEVVAARSKAEVARLAGVKRPAQLFNLGETGNHDDIEKALSAPGTVFWRPIGDYARSSWRAAT